MFKLDGNFGKRPNVTCHIMTAIFTDKFETRLGTIGTWLQSDCDSCNQEQEKFIAKGHSIYCQIFDLKQFWTPDTMEYETSKGWRWFIQKTNDLMEQLTLFCKLKNPSDDTEWCANSGEYLDAIEIENKTHHLHIGTEDGEMMQYRSKISDWMPERFKDEIGFFKSFTEYVDFGFRTSLPKLQIGERIYFHFIVATNTIKPSKDYPNERDLATWFAVDQSKKYLDEKLSKTAGNSGLASVGLDQ